MYDEAQAYWELKKRQGSPEDLETPIKMAFMRGWQMAENDNKQFFKDLSDKNTMHGLN